MPIERGSPKWYARLAELEAEEAKHPEVLWCLSFADPERPKGTQWLGNCLVRARGMTGAIRESHRLGCNPGGQVMAISGDREVGAQWMNRLLSKEEVAELDCELGGDGTIVDADGKEIED